MTSSLVDIESCVLSCDLTTMRYDDTTHTFDYNGSDRNYDMRLIQLRYDYDEKRHVHFFACVELEAGAHDTS